MTRIRPDRRTVLLGATAALAALAGCAGGDDEPATDDEPETDDGPATDDEPETDDEPAADDTQESDDDDQEPEPASFVVGDLEPEEATATVGDTVEVAAAVENVGEERDTVAVELRIDDEGVDDTALEVPGGEREQATFEADTAGLEPGEYTHSVWTADDEQAGTLVLEAFGDDELETAATGVPAYASWLSDGPELFVSETDYAGAEAVEAYAPLFDELADDALADEEFALGEAFDDVEGIAEILPLETSVAVLFVIAFFGFEYPFLEDVEFPGDDEPPTEPVMSVERLTLADEVIVLAGEVDADALEGREDVEEVDAEAAFGLYRSNPEFGDPVPFAASEDEIVFPESGQSATDDDAEEAFDDALERLRATLDGRGDAALPGDAEWLLERCGDGVFVFGGFEEEIDDAEDEIVEFPGWEVEEADAETVTDGLSGVTGILLVADAHSDGRVTRSGFSFESRENVPGSAFVEAFTVGADRRNVLVEGNRMIVEAFWS